MDCLNVYNDAFWEFVLLHKHDDVHRLALTLSNSNIPNMTLALTQIEGWQTALMKLPSWAAHERLLYPPHLSMEQCSSEATARYKSSLVEGESFVDLTAGAGVDFSFMARRFRQADYVERQELLCDFAKHNLPLLGLRDAGVHNVSAEEYLRKMGHVDCIFIDPSRRNSNGGRTVRIAECEPDVAKLLPEMKAKSDIVMIKLSPMLDISAAIAEIGGATAVHVVAARNECKELLVLVTDKVCGDGEVAISCANVSTPDYVFNFRLSDERKAACQMADRMGEYLYEPNAAIMKAGPFRLLSQRLGVKKLHPNSHLFTSDRLICFPGRSFHVEGVSGFSKKELKAFLSGLTKANVAVRNFPSSPEELRRRLKLKDGGDTFIFATTILDDCNGGTHHRQVLVKCKRV